jgi:hypothetical protein
LRSRLPLAETLAAGWLLARAGLEDAAHADDGRSAASRMIASTLAAGGTLSGPRDREYRSPARRNRSLCCLSLQASR